MPDAIPQVAHFEGCVVVNGWRFPPDVRSRNGETFDRFWVPGGWVHSARFDELWDISLEMTRLTQIPK